MPSVLNILPNAAGQAEQKIFTATVSTKMQTPASPLDPLYLEVDWNPTVIEVSTWPRMHGDLLPSAGDYVLLVDDGERNLKCVFWEPDLPVMTEFRGYRNGSLTTSAGWSKITLDVRSHDPGQNYDFTNSRYSVPKTGVYMVTGQVEISGPVSASAGVMDVAAGVYRNGSEVSRGSRTSVSTATASVVGSSVADQVRCVAGDYLELWIYTGASAVLDVPNITVNNSGSSLSGAGVTNYLAIAQVA